MIVKLLTEHNLEFQSLKGGCRGSPSQHLSKCQIVGNLMLRLIYSYSLIPFLYQVYSFGCNDEGTLGRVTSEEGSETVPGKVDGLPKIVQVCAGDSHTAALSDDGRVFAWGNFRVSSNTFCFL